MDCCHQILAQTADLNKRKVGRMSRRMQYLLLKERENGGWRSQKKQGNSKRKNMYTMTIWEQHFKWKKNMLCSSLQTKTNGDRKDTRQQQIIFTFHVLGLYACIIHLSVAIRLNHSNIAVKMLSSVCDADARALTAFGSTGITGSFVANE
jgi:hypothetical protein